MSAILHVPCEQLEDSESHRIVALASVS